MRARACRVSKESGEILSTHADYDAAYPPLIGAPTVLVSVLLGSWEQRHGLRWRHARPASHDHDDLARQRWVGAAYSATLTASGGSALPGHSSGFPRACRSIRPQV